MIFFDGTYRLATGPDSGADAIRSRIDGWRVRIINLSVSHFEVAYLRPFIVVVTSSGETVPAVSCAECLGKRIFRDFDLAVSQTLWVESRADVFVATFSPQSQFGPDISYAVSWRSIRPDELDMVSAFVSEL